MTTAPVQIPVMFGLRTRRLQLMLIVLTCAYLYTRATAFANPRDGWQWVFEAVGAIGLCGCVYATTRGEADPLPVAWTAAVALVGTAALAASWWATPASAGVWVQPGAGVVVFAVIVGLLAMRGRARTAWTCSAFAVVLAAVWSLQHGGTLIAGGQLTLRIAVSLLPATLMAVLIRPMLRLTGVLEARRAQSMHAMAVTSATMSARLEQLHKFDADVRPYLQRVADGDDFDVESAARARILEEDLRDSVRGRGWHVEATRQALADARLRGIAVRVFDDTVDGGGLTADDLGVLRTGLIEVLAAADDGAVTARILPAGREYTAVITTVTAGSVERVVCRRDADRLVWSTGDPVPAA